LQAVTFYPDGKSITIRVSDEIYALIWNAGVDLKKGEDDILAFVHQQGKKEGKIQFNLEYIKKCIEKMKEESKNLAN